VGSMRPAKRTEFLELKFVWSALLIFCRRIITTFACSTCKSNNISHTHPPNRKSILAVTQAECLHIKIKQ
jgi:hypothetical protein